MSEQPLDEVLEEAAQSAHPAELGPKLAQMVEEEAARAEAQDPELEPTEPAPEPGAPEPEPEPPAPEPEPEPEEEDEEAQALASIRVAYQKILADFPGELDVVACPLCAHSPIPGALPFALAFDPTKQRCRTCSGLGEVITGSLVSGEESGQCPTCTGRGYEDLTEGAPPPLAQPAPVDSELGYVPISPAQPPALPALAPTG